MLGSVRSTSNAKFGARIKTRGRQFANSLPIEFPVRRPMCVHGLCAMHLASARISKINVPFEHYAQTHTYTAKKKYRNRQYRFCRRKNHAISGSHTLHFYYILQSLCTTRRHPRNTLYTLTIFRCVAITTGSSFISQAHTHTHALKEFN